MSDKAVYRHAPFTPVFYGVVVGGVISIATMLFVSLWELLQLDYTLDIGPMFNPIGVWISSGLGIAIAMWFFDSSKGPKGGD
jgi:hypothetical protein